MSNKKELKLNLQKLLVGHFIESIPDDCNKKVSYVWDGSGVWEVRRLPLGTFTTCVHKFETTGLKSSLEAGWELNVPKIPATFLDVTLSFFRQIYKQHSSEVFLQYFYDTEKKEYTIYCPKQVVGPGSVNYTRDAEFEKGKILVFEIHSHGSMGAFFSGTDDADEKDDRFFGVIGNVKNYYPDMKIRLSVGGRKVEIEVEDIFDMSESLNHMESFPFEWVDRIKKKKVKVNKKGKHIRSGSVYYPSAGDFDYFEEFNKTKGKEKLVEKNGVLYNVIDNGKEEIWEELNTNDVDKKNEVKNVGKEPEEEIDYEELIDHWRSIRW